jgi:hypothetical protein
MMLVGRCVFLREREFRFWGSLRVDTRQEVLTSSTFVTQGDTACTYLYRSLHLRGHRPVDR